MKTIPTSSILSLVIATLASACSSQVSLGRNDKAVTSSDSGSGSGGEGSDWGSSTTGSAGTVSSGFGGAPSSVPHVVDGGSEGCGPVGDWVAGTSLTSEPGQYVDGDVQCASVLLPPDIHIAALHMVNEGDMLDTFVAIVPDVGSDSGTALLPPWSTACAFGWTGMEPSIVASTTGGPETFVLPAGGLDVSGAQRILLGMHRPAGMLGSATAKVAIATSVGAGLGCVPQGPTMQLESSEDLPPGNEEFLCYRKTLDGSFGTSFIRMVSDPGVLDAVLSAGDATGPDGQEICDATADATTVLAIADDAGTVEARPNPVHLVTGQQLVLRAHFVNVTDRVQHNGVRVSLY